MEFIHKLDESVIEALNDDRDRTFFPRGLQEWAQFKVPCPSKGGCCFVTPHVIQHFDISGITDFNALTMKVKVMGLQLGLDLRE